MHKYAEIILTVDILKRLGSNAIKCKFQSFDITAIIANLSKKASAFYSSDSVGP